MTQRFKISKHARERMQARGISMKLVKAILSSPDQIIPDEKENEDVLIYQSIKSVKGEELLIRIFVNVKRTPPLVITVYKTSKITKYFQ